MAQVKTWLQLHQVSPLLCLILLICKMGMIAIVPASLSFKKILSLIFRERGRGEKCDWLPPAPPPSLPMGDGAYNSGMCPNLESNRQPFGAGTIPHQLRHSGQGLTELFGD